MVVRPSPSSASSSASCTQAPSTHASSVNFFTRWPREMSSWARKRLKLTGFRNVIRADDPLCVMRAPSARFSWNTASIACLKARPRRLSAGWMRPSGVMGKFSSRVEFRPTDL